MKHLINYCVLFMASVFIYIFDKTLCLYSVPCITALLVAIALASFDYFINLRIFTNVTAVIYGILTFICPAFIPMASISIYAATYHGSCVILVMYILSAFAYYLQNNNILLLLILLVYMLAIYLQKSTSQYEDLLNRSRKMRDDSTELNILLKQKNESLLQKQDYEIYNATLQERNRIAREIHDNVGHMLSRAILLTGAIKAINKDENCKESLNHLHDALSQAMNSIRSSVHDLHDESVNLKDSIDDLVDEFTFCDINYNYDMGYEVPKEIKYSFIAVVKEALTNVERHSNATHVTLTLREHPALYQLIIQDNGTSSSSFDSSIYISDTYCSGPCGIGLNNIYSRVSSLHGTIQIDTTNGFNIFIAIPKSGSAMQED